MTYYHIHALNTVGRIAGNSIDVVCSSDPEACRAANYTLVNGARAEVWSGCRYVGTVSAPELKLIEVAGRRSAEPRSTTLPQVVTLAGAPALSWGRPDLFAEIDLATRPAGLR